MHRERLARLVTGLTCLLLLAGVLLFGVQQQTRLVDGEGVDPARWAQAYPEHYASFQRTALNEGPTAYGGSEPVDLLAANPFRAKAFAGHAFALEYTAARGHHYAQQDQRHSRRTRELVQPAGCINCHAAEAPQLIAELGWEGLHALDYAAVQERVHTGSSCSDCHDGNMELQLTRPALLQALQAQGIDPATLPRSELRTLVCAQCHVEYYFRAGDRVLVFPWGQGQRLEDIEAWYDAIGHTDWVHAQSGAPLLKAQHPETELHGAGPHAWHGVSCVDCHMPKVEEAGRLISDHWFRSPLRQLPAACLGCHRGATAESLQARVVAVQDATSALSAVAEAELAALIDAIVVAQAAGLDAARLDVARQAHRRAQFRWDFVDAENSSGFHAPRESARLLRAAADLAREARTDLQSNALTP